MFQRPIVGFSIENKAILNAKQRRMELSRNKNPYYQREKKEVQKDGGKPAVRSVPADRTDKQEAEDFAGLEAHPSQTVKLPTRGTLRSQAALHRQSIQKDKKKNKLQRKQLLEKKRKQQKVINIRHNTADLMTLLSHYMSSRNPSRTNI